MNPNAPAAASAQPDRRKKILVLFGTRPEVIKLAPVIQQLEARPDVFQTVTVNSGQHADLLAPFLSLFAIRVDYDLKVMQPGQSPGQVCSRVLAALEDVLVRERPDLVLVQGDTSTAVAGALAAFYQQIPVGHVEAGLRTHDPYSPFPEEMNRRLITQLATYHFAPTEGNRRNLLAEGVAPERIFVTGNPVVDAVQDVRKRLCLSPEIEQLLHATRHLKRLVLTTHRRESFGTVLPNNLRIIREFIERHEDVGLFFPVHPNPVVVDTARRLLSDHPRIYLLAPLDYMDFLALLAAAWLVLSDSGGIQEEAPTLGKALLILRDTTERPEALVTGMAHLAGADPACLQELLEEAYEEESCLTGITRAANPFGQGDSGRTIVRLLAQALCVPGTT